MTAYLTDVLVHAGMGVAFACTGACARYVCKHRLHQVLAAAALVLLEAALIVRVVG